MIPIMNDQQRTDNELAAMGAGDWGYRVFPRPGGGNLGYGELAVAIRERPTHQHFDPLRLRFRLLDPEGDVRWRTASWRVPVMDSGRICPGPVTLADRYEKEVEFFTFGGAVDVISNPTALVCLFTSAAPILELTAKANAVSDQLASEAEEIIGRVGEQWQEEYDEGFAERLIEVEPFSLYIAVLNTILLRYRATPALSETYPALHSALKKEREWLLARDLWPDEPSSVEELILRPV
jgi:hypothetical protein